MSILNYFFIGTVFTFILDLILYKLKDNSLMKDIIKKWGYKERIACIIVCPLAAIAFIYTFIKDFFKKIIK